MDIQSQELPDGGIVIEKTERTANALRKLRIQQLVSDVHHWCGREFVSADSIVVRNLKGKSPLMDVSDLDAENLRSTIGVLINRAEIGNWELDLGAVSLQGMRPKFLIINESTIDCLNVTHNNDPHTLIIANNSKVKLLKTSVENFQFVNIITAHTQFSITALVHRRGDSPLIKDDRRYFTISNVEVQCIYSDASNISLNDLSNLKAIIHPQPTEASFFLKSVIFRFDLKPLVAGLMWKSKPKATLAWWREYFANPAVSTDERWARIDMGLAENVALAESTIKALYERSSLIVSNEDYSRYLYYLNSRSNKVRRVLYWFNGAYYNIKIPFIGTLVCLGGMIGALVWGNRPVSDMFMTIDPKHLISNYLLSDLSFAHPIAFTKYLFAACFLPFFYSLFCLGLALKRKFGFPNEIK